MKHEPLSDDYLESARDYFTDKTSFDGEPGLVKIAAKVLLNEIDRLKAEMKSLEEDLDQANEARTFSDPEVKFIVDAQRKEIDRLKAFKKAVKEQNDG